MGDASLPGSSLDVPCPARTALRLSVLSLATLVLGMWLLG
jgi:hypothetical protein